MKNAVLEQGHQVYEKLDQALLAKRLSLMLSLFESCSRWTSWFRAEAEPAAAASADSSDLFRHKFQSLADLWAGQFLDGTFLSSAIKKHMMTSRHASRCSGLGDGPPGEPPQRRQRW